MPALPGFNLIFHSVRRGGGMERHVLDMIGWASTHDMACRVVTRRLDWPGTKPAGVEFIVVPDRTPFSRLNTHRFETRSLRRVRPDWPTIAVSRVPGAELSVVGGTHRAHLLARGRTRPGFADRSTLAREQSVYERARRVVCHSAMVADEVTGHYGIDPSKVVTLYPPVDSARFSLAARVGRDALRQSIGIGARDLLLLFPSNDHVRKGGELIVQALDGADARIRLVVAGKAPLDAPAVINLGFRSDMPALYAAADAVILASHYEAFGLVGPEAILCGTPVLFSNNVGAAEVLSDRACLRFERTVPALRAALATTLARHDAGTLALLDEPGRHIRYLYALDQHFGALFDLLAQCWQVPR